MRRDFELQGNGKPPELGISVAQLLTCTVTELNSVVWDLGLRISAPKKEKEKKIILQLK